MYIVTSKPKRISVNSGLVHIVALLVKFDSANTQLVLQHGTHCGQIARPGPAEITEMLLMIFIRFREKCSPDQGSSSPDRMAIRASSAELEAPNFCLIL